MMSRLSNFATLLIDDDIDLREHKIWLYELYFLGVHK